MGRREYLAVPGDPDALRVWAVVRHVQPAREKKKVKTNMMNMQSRNVFHLFVPGGAVEEGRGLGRGGGLVSGEIFSGGAANAEFIRRRRESIDNKGIRFCAYMTGTAAPAAMIGRARWSLVRVKLAVGWN